MLAPSLAALLLAAPPPGLPPADEPNADRAALVRIAERIEQLGPRIEKADERYTAYRRAARLQQKYGDRDAGRRAWLRVEETIGTIEGRQASLDPVRRVEVAAGLFDCGDPDGARRLLDAARKEAEASTEANPAQGLSFLGEIAGETRREDLDGWKAFHEELERRIREDPRLSSNRARSLAGLWTRAGFYERALRSAAEIPPGDLAEPDRHISEVLWSLNGAIWNKLDRLPTGRDAAIEALDQATTMAGGMTNLELRTDILSRIGETVVEIGNLDAAIQIARSLPDLDSAWERRLYFLNMVAQYDLDAGRTAEALEMAGLLRDGALRVPEEDRRDSSLIGVASLQARAGGIEAARETIDRLDPRLRAAPLIDLAAALRKAGDEPAARAALDRALDSVAERAGQPLVRPERIQGQDPAQAEAESALLTLMRVRIARGEIDEARKAAAELPVHRRRVAAIYFAQDRIKAGDLDGALAEIDRLESPEDQSAALGLLAWEIEHRLGTGR